MGRKSKIESHPQSEEIISLLFNGTKNPEILRKYSGITEDDLDYYRDNKLDEKLSKSKDLKALADEIESADIHKGDTYLQLVVGLQKKALDALEVQDAAGDPKSWAMISREARGYLELLGRALDRIRDQPQINLTQVNIYNSPEWRDVGAVLARVLAGYPDLKAEVAKELLALERGAK
jgi:uncharacterized protein (DUF433 family)